MIRLRPAEPSDEWTFFSMRRQIQPTLTRETHMLWWTTAIEYRFIAHDGPATVGILRVTPEGVISILVTEKERGKGLGTQMLQALKPAARALGFTRLRAHVDLENPASRAAFTSAGYLPTRFEIAL